MQLLTDSQCGELNYPELAPILLNTVGKELFKQSITWSKIISLLAISGGLAIDCIRQGHYDYIKVLIDGTTDFIEDDLANWILLNGGWLGLRNHFLRNIHPQRTSALLSRNQQFTVQLNFLNCLTISVVFLMIVSFIYILLKSIGTQFYTYFY